jgi:hypothetical protein
VWWGLFSSRVVNWPPRRAIPDGLLGRKKSVEKDFTGKGITFTLTVQRILIE